MRASDDFRERTVARLGAGYEDGMLGLDTLCHRVDSAYAARSVEHLCALVRDLPAPRGLLRDALERVGRRFSGKDPLEETLPVLAPPRREPGACYVIGRDPSCDLSLGDPTVSRRHAVLRRGHDRWMLADLDSSNGTYLNGWRVRGDVELEPGDGVGLGNTAWVFAPRT